MDIKKLLSFMVLWAGLLISPADTAWAKPPVITPTITVSSEQWQSYTSPDGSGYFFELIKAIYQPLGYAIKYQICPWKRCIRSVLDGHADISVGLYDDEIGEAGMLILPRYPINLEKVFVAFKKDTPWHGQHSLKNQKVVELRGYNYHLELEVPVKSVEANDTHQAWRILMADRAQYYLSDIRQIEWAMDYYNTPKESLNIEAAFKKWAYYAFKNSPRGKELLTQFEQQLPKLYANGTVKALQHKYQLPWYIPLHDTKTSGSP